VNILDSIKKAVMEDDAKPALHAPEPVAPTYRATPLTPSWPAATAVAPTQYATPPSSDDVTALTAKVHPKSGPLIQFMATMESLAEDIADEGRRFHAAEKILMKQGVDTRAVLAEITAISGRIESEVAAFEASRQHKTETEVTSRESTIADTVRQIQACEASLKEMTGRRDETGAALTAAKAKIAERAEQFAGTVRAVRSQYDDLTRKINLYLIGGQSK
jgi:hypothetical protein